MTNEALRDPIKFEMAYITSLEQLDQEILLAREEFSSSLNLDSVENIVRGV